jgi:hypothetical protein
MMTVLGPCALLVGEVAMAKENLGVASKEEEEEFPYKCTSHLSNVKFLTPISL